MKIAYQNKDCYMSDDGEWEECTRCVFCQSKNKDVWPCDLIPKLRCYGGDIYRQTDQLKDIFQV